MVYGPSIRERLRGAGDQHTMRVLGEARVQSTVYVVCFTQCPQGKWKRRSG